jgi:pyrroloquinoline-quinone synthase
MTLDAIRSAAQAQLSQRNIHNNPYFLALKTDLSLPDFCQTQTQFFFAVTFFSRPMAALIGRIPDPTQRLTILHNLVEEHGDFDVAGFHHSTFLDFLERLGCPTDNIEEVILWPEVRAFNSTLSTACVLDEVEVGIACMGVIELAFADISATIGQAVIARGWLTAEQLTHYKLHAEIDNRHADEFFAILETSWQHPEKRYLIEQGLSLGAYIFNRLYTDLYAKTAHFHTVDMQP